MNIQELISILTSVSSNTEVAIEIDGLHYALECEEIDGKLHFISGHSPPRDMKFGPGKDNEKDVHTEHCCYFCGCKYMDENCTVKNGILRQSRSHFETSVCYDLKPGYYPDF